MRVRHMASATPDVDYGYLPVRAVTHCEYPPKDGQAELTWVAGIMPSAHITINRAVSRVASLIETGALPLSQTDTCNCLHMLK